MLRNFKEINSVQIVPRTQVAFVLVSVAFALITFRLWYLQIAKGEYFRDRSDNNRLQIVPLSAPRGHILDRSGHLLVSNRPAFNIELITENPTNEKPSVEALAKVLNLPEQQLLNQLKNQRKRRKFEPKLLIKDVSRDVVAKVYANRFRLPGIIVNVVPARKYLRNDFAAHVLGYIREISQRQLDTEKYKENRLGDLVGQAGLELVWENILQGKPGAQRVIVNANGNRVGELERESDEIGDSIQLTIDSATQEAADNALKERPGAVVAVDPRTGQVLAMSSSLRYDPNAFTSGIPQDMWQSLMENKKLRNKTIQGGYPPGSVHKVFVAVAGLAEGVIKPSDTVHCPGSYSFVGRNYKCHKKTGHGTVNLHTAITQSCDVYFYQLGLKLGVDRIHKWLSLFGFDNATGIGLPDESSGLIPSSDWKRKAHKNQGDKKWYAGETLSVAIGQGANKVTPLQTALGISTLVNGGHLYKPRIVKAILDKDGNFKQRYDLPEEIYKIAIDQKILDLIKYGMVGVVNEPGGTGKRAQLDKVFNIKVGGKTGTAQVVSLTKSKAEKNEEKYKDHAWFVGYAPAEDPQIVVVALMENAGGGGLNSAPVVRQVMEAFFKEITPLSVDVSQIGVTPTPTFAPTQAPAKQVEQKKPEKKKAN